MKGRIEWDAAFFFEYFSEGCKLIIRGNLAGPYFLKTTITSRELTVAPGADFNRAAKFMKMTIGGVAGRAGLAELGLIGRMIAEITMFLFEALKVCKAKKL